jgi:hypothetical protein
MSEGVCSEASQGKVDNQTVHGGRGLTDPPGASSVARKEAAE